MGVRTVSVTVPAIILREHMRREYSLENTAIPCDIVRDGVVPKVLNEICPVGCESHGRVQQIKCPKRKGGQLADRVQMSSTNAPYYPDLRMRMNIEGSHPRSKANTYCTLEDRAISGVESVVKHRLHCHDAG